MYGVKDLFGVGVQKHLKIVETEVRTVEGVFVDHFEGQQNFFYFLKSVGVEDSALQNLLKNLFSNLLRSQVIIFVVHLILELLLLFIIIWIQGSSAEKGANCQDLTQKL